MSSWPSCLKRKLTNRYLRRAFWRMWRDDIVKRDMEWLHTINPNGDTLESWMRTNKYTGHLREKLLKNVEDNSTKLLLRDREEIARL